MVDFNDATVRRDWKIRNAKLDRLIVGHSLIIEGPSCCHRINVPKVSQVETLAGKKWPAPALWLQVEKVSLKRHNRTKNTQLTIKSFILGNIQLLGRVIVHWLSYRWKRCKKRWVPWRSIWSRTW